MGHYVDTFGKETDNVSLSRKSKIVRKKIQTPYDEDNLAKAVLMAMDGLPRDQIMLKTGYDNPPLFNQHMRRYRDIGSGELISYYNSLLKIGFKNAKRWVWLRRDKSTLAFTTSAGVYVMAGFATEDPVLFKSLDIGVQSMISPLARLELDIEPRNTVIYALGKQNGQLQILRRLENLATFEPIDLQALNARNITIGSAFESVKKVMDAAFQYEALAKQIGYSPIEK